MCSTQQRSRSLRLCATQELWQLLISANETGTGIPQRFLDEKAAEMQRAKEEAEMLQARPGLLSWGMR